MKILLVQPPYGERFIPYGLLKISSYHKAKGNEVKYVYGHYIGSFIPDVIYITTLFTFHFRIVKETVLFYKHMYPNAQIKIGGIMATDIPEKIEQEVGIKPHVGLINEAEQYGPDWSLMPDLKYTYGFTTRGCIRKCPWCMVRFHEPNYIELKHWEQHLQSHKKKVILWDNNFLACSREHFDSVIDKLKALKKPVDFNQALDIRLLDEYKCDRLAEIRLDPWRFAFDHASQEEAVIKGIKMIKKRINVHPENLRFLMLYNYEETPEEAHRRVKVVKDLGGSPFVMRYKPLDWTEETFYVSPKWTRQEVIWFSQYYNRLSLSETRTWDEFIEERKASKKPEPKEYELTMDDFKEV